MARNQAHGKPQKKSRAGHGWAAGGHPVLWGRGGGHVWLSTCHPRVFVPAGAAAGCRPCSAEEHAGIGVLTADTGGTVPGGRVAPGVWTATSGR